MLNGIPPRVFALVYLGMIPLYAAFYSFLPASFYHSTVGYEAALARDVAEIENGLRDSILAGIREHYGTDRIVVGQNVTIDISSIDVRVTVKNGVFSFSLFFEGRKDNALGAYSFSVLPMFLFRKGADEEEFMLMSQERYEPEGLRLIDLCPHRAGYKARISAPNDNQQGFVVLPKRIQDRIQGYLAALQGFPSKASGNFLRMLYFSVVTITTVGFGDIVPITGLARSLVASEAILGVVTIGFFLNAVSGKRNGA